LSLIEGGARPNPGRAHIRPGRANIRYVEMGGLPAFPVERTRVSGRRLVAHLADGVLYGVLFAVLILVAAAIGNAALAIAFVLGLTVLNVAYYVVLERPNGRTPGKRLVGLRVVDAAGQVPTTSALVKRTIPLLIEYVYVIALIGMLTSEYRQRFGDRWGKTYVIED
jgi:uncharacterized RDD family membrane protein YckC